MAELNPKRKVVSYPLSTLTEIQEALEHVERLALEEEGGSGDASRSICSELNNVRDHLSLPRGVQRHSKWANDKGDAK